MKNLTPLISVIVPIYNVEAYLSECLDSILQQTYKNLEVILINDGSKDSSQAIAEGYVEKDKRFQLVNQENKGIAAARNKGLEFVHGEYIMFFDSDDKIALDAIENLLTPINGKTRIFSMGKYSTKDILEQQHKDIQTNSVKGTLLTRLKAVQSSGYPSFSAWGKLYSRDVFETIRFPIIRVHEDTAVILPVIDSVDEVVLVNQTLWYYRQVASSITNVNISDRNFTIFDKNEMQIKFAKEKHPEILNYVYKLCMNENDFVMMKCISDGSDYSMVLFKKLFLQNQYFSKVSKQRRFFYWNINFYKVYLKLSLLFYNNEFIRGIAKKILT
ncbi:glycosyltransferase family 2 protein [Lactococcus raffinolactis]|uniref:glycosyltransferase family 2 protein n=1 Tax=Pseudolactococcus raffinolactis TaxID=1366 RepID=UPI00288EF331|nr:glycosyltransferase family 2 protein [Lactococcus raffinolactis]MDT2766941.1 glycosyltransferase family 2 protein [Lactococcus raffinolactis]MDT2790121.1 glycosyltransferase family 2 protein [Lactococcus raffinolactis]